MQSRLPRPSKGTSSRQSEPGAKNLISEVGSIVVFAGAVFALFAIAIDGHWQRPQTSPPDAPTQSASVSQSSE